MSNSILILFFTRNVSLKLWVDSGLFEREKVIYERHLVNNNFKKIYWITYGSADKRLADLLKKSGRLHSNIHICQMPKAFNIPKLGSYLYSFFIPFYYKKILLKSSLLKTNQIDGSWSAVISKCLYKKPLIIRTGYTASHLECTKKYNSLICKKFRFIERLVYKYSDFSIVSSNESNQYVKKKYCIDKAKIVTLYNYINLEDFRPRHKEEKSNRILFVGRLNMQKNLFNLIQAISNTGLTLDIYGSGELERELHDFVLANNVAVNFCGVKSNIELARIYNKYRYYILPSVVEGMPKTLLEAMSSGCLCIGTNVPGINEIIRNGETGILAKSTSVEDLTDAIHRAVSEQDKNTIISKSVCFIHEMCDVNKIVEKEYRIMSKLIR
jgi:glycosyltransferase involved in cell wall biosynthesis